MSSVDRFEVISRVDEAPAFGGGTSNPKSVYFTYFGNNSATKPAVTINQWVDYLKAIVNFKKTDGTNAYRPIDTLTIFAHGNPGEVLMSNAFSLKNDDATMKAFVRLRDEGILSENATILLMSCNVGQDKTFMKNLANWAGATVYANTQSTGTAVQVNGNGLVDSDWYLDVIGIPDGYKATEFTAAVRPAIDTVIDGVTYKTPVDTTLMIPGGAVVKIAAGTLAEDDTVIVKNVSGQLAELGVNTNSGDILGAYEISFLKPNNILSGQSLS
ncbi:DUF4347 domain-containing protein, partial [bacterium]|nr:DUF4347 domain-containing protein [bacterium]